MPRLNPLELSAEAQRATASAVESEGPTPDVAELQGQFEQQQNLIAHLRDTLQRNEQQRSTKEKEVEEYAATLSRIRTQRRGKGTPRKREEKQVVDPEEGSGSSGTAADTSLKTPQKSSASVLMTTPITSATPTTPVGSGKMNLLRQKMEENRQILEQRGRQMHENKQSIDVIMEQMKVQLEEKEQSTEELKRSQEPSDPAPSIDHVSDQQSREMYAHILYKDNKIIELNNRILELERNVIDYQENLREKDSVIDARTRAISLMSEDLSRKNKTTVDTLEETRQEMRTMQAQFVELEAKLRSENKTLSDSIVTKDKRLAQLESTRFDLSTRNAELQQKVVYLQTKSHEVLAQGLPADKTRIEELTQQLEDQNKQAMKTKAQYRHKVKNLEKQVASLKKAELLGDELQSLQNRIAELEEEKGNLQLALVDFDEMKATDQNLKDCISKLEKEVAQLTSERDTSVETVLRLEADNFEIKKNLQHLTASESELQSELIAIQTAHQEIENAKVEAEMKAVELEEKLDSMSTSRAELQAEFEGHKFSNIDSKELANALEDLKIAYANTEKELKVALDDLNTERNNTTTLDVNLRRDINNLQKMIEASEEKLSKKDEQLNELRIQCQDFESQIDQYKTEFATLNDQLAKQCEELRGTKTLKEELQEKSKEIDDLRNQLQENQANVSSHLSKDEQKDLEEKVSKLTLELQELQVSNSDQVDMMQRSQLAVSAKETEHEAEVEALTMEVEQKQQRACDLEEQLSETMAAHQVLQTTFEKVNQELADVLKFKKEAEITIEDISEKLRKTNEQSHAKDSEKALLLEQLEALKIDMEEGAQILSLTQSSLREVQHELEEKNATLQSASQAEQALESLQSEFAQLQRKFQNEGAALRKSVAQAEEELTESYSRVELLTKDHRAATEMWSSEKDSLMVELLELKGEKYNLQDSIRELQDNSTSLQVQLGVIIGEREVLEAELTTLRDASVESKLLKDQVDYFAKLVSDLQSQLVHEKQQSLSNYQDVSNENKALQCQLQESSNLVAHLQSQLSAGQQQISSHVHVLQEENKVLSSFKEESTKLYSELQEKYSELQRMHEQKSLEAKTLHTEKQVVEAELWQLQEGVSDFKLAVRNLEDALDIAQLEKESLHEEIHSLLQRVTELQVTEDMLEACRREIGDLHTELTQLQGEHKTITKQLCEREALVKELEQFKNGFTVEDHHQLQDNIGLLNAELEERERNMQEMNSQLNQAMQRSDQDRENNKLIVANLQKLTEEYRDKLEDYEKNRESLVNQLHESREYCLLLQNNVSDLQNSMQAMRLSEMEQAGNYIELTSRLKATEEVNSNLQEEIKELHRVMEKNPVWQEDNTVEDLMSRLEASQQEKIKLKEEIQELVQKVQDGRFTSQETSNTEQHQQALLLSDVESLHVEIETLKKELETAREEMAKRDQDEIVKDVWEEQDSWGEAGLEEQRHQQEQLQTPTLDPLLVAALQAQLAEAESAQIKLQEELRVSQVRCGKLIKQVKTLKEQSAKKRSSDLDKVFEEELQSQLSALQKELREVQAEKTAILARADTLAAANDRLVDIKEQQEADLERSRAERLALTQELNSLQQWQHDEEINVNTPLNPKIAELEMELQIAEKKYEELEELLSQKSLLQETNDAPAQVEEILTSKKVATIETGSTSIAPAVKISLKDIGTETEPSSNIPEETEYFKKQLELKERELQARVEEHHSLAAHIAQLRGALEAKSQELASMNDQQQMSDMADMKSELDAALYLLHQRDVRCDELTVELMALMEERDSLQLRLSSALRLNEQRKATAPELNLPEDKSGQQELNSKLTELRALGHGRDVTLRGDREMRHSDQQLFIQPTPRSGTPTNNPPQHIAESDHTLMRDTQSSSSVLMNWLWGRSTPRAVQNL